MIKIKIENLAVIVFIFVIGFGVGSWGYKYYSKSGFSKTKTETQISITAPSEDEVKDLVESDSNVIDINADSYNVLLLGKGGSGHSGGDLADSIIVVHIETDSDSKDKKAVLISIPRDFWFYGHKLNADPSIRDAVTAITGLSIDSQIQIDFGSFVSAIDKMGGIEITIPKPYTDNYYPIRGLENELCGFSPEKVAELHNNYSGFNLEKQFTCRYETIYFDTGRSEIDGETALKYVRSRHGDGDFGRSERQFVGIRPSSWQDEGGKDFGLQAFPGFENLIEKGYFGGGKVSTGDRTL